MKQILFALLALCVILLYTGCGQNGDMLTSDPGEVRLTILWPERKAWSERFIPRAAESIVATIDGAVHDDMATIARPNGDPVSVVTFTQVPAGDYAVTITAFPEPDGAGEPLATAAATTAVASGAATAIAVDLTSTIQQVVIDQYPASMTSTGTAHLLASARNAAGDMVPVLPQPDGFHWSTSDTAIASIDQTGLLTAHASGNITVCAMERETGVTGSVQLRIDDSGSLVISIASTPIRVIITPDAVTLAPSAPRQFTAAVIGVPNQHVLWSCSGGAIDRTGLYTAPETPGTCQVTATAVADPSATTTVTVTVRDPAAAEKIVFMSNRDVYWQVYTMDSDGNNLLRLTDHGAHDYYPSWSPDGSRVVFMSKRTGNAEIFIMDADGGNQTRLTSNGADDTFPSFSPDGTTIAFHSNRDGSYEIYTMNTDGGDLTRLTVDGGHNVYPCFSPDGNRIIFASRRDGNSEIYSMGVDGSDLTRLTNHAATDEMPAVSPDGNRIVFASKRDGNYEIYAMNADGSDLTRLTVDGGNDLFPSFSPDGSRILFTSVRDGNDELYVMDADGANQTRITTDIKSDYFGRWGVANR